MFTKKDQHVSSARFWHFAFALAFLVMYLLGATKRRQGVPNAQLLCFVVTLPMLYLGSAISDWDISYFGIGGHRNPLFHSSAPYFLLVAVARLLGLTSWLPTLMTILSINLALGLSSHLVLDVIQYGDVRWIPGSTLDRLWLMAHAVLLGVAAWFAAPPAHPLSNELSAP